MTMRTRTARRSIFGKFDPLLTVSVALLLVLGVILVYAATRDWLSGAGRDPQYYLKRQLINVIIGIDRKSTRLNSSHSSVSRMPSSA